MSSPDETAVVSALVSALARVLGQQSGAGMRADTVLADIGVDSLARVLLVDACADDGLRLDPQVAWTARTVGDLLGAPGLRDSVPAMDSARR